jgi:hypothetical protein
MSTKIMITLAMLLLMSINAAAINKKEQSTAIQLYSSSDIKGEDPVNPTSHPQEKLGPSGHSSSDSDAEPLLLELSIELSYYRSPEVEPKRTFTGESVLEEASLSAIPLNRDFVVSGSLPNFSKQKVSDGFSLFLSSATLKELPQHLEYIDPKRQELHELEFELDGQKCVGHGYLQPGEPLIVEKAPGESKGTDMQPGSRKIFYLVSWLRAPEASKHCPQHAHFWFGEMSESHKDVQRVLTQVYTFDSIVQAPCFQLNRLETCEVDESERLIQVYIGFLNKKGQGGKQGVASAQIW